MPEPWCFSTRRGKTMPIALVLARPRRGRRPPNYVDRTGRRYGKWTALRPCAAPYSDGSLAWVCTDGTTERVIPSHRLREYARGERGRRG